jgi:hypothetical protein
MGFDLRTKAGRSNFWFVWKRRKGAYRLNWREVLGDTFLPIVCFVICHEPYNTNDMNVYGPPEWACKRCRHYLPTQVQR